MTRVTPTHRLDQEPAQRWEVGRKGRAGVTVADVTQLPGTASSLVLGMLSGPRKPVQVLGSGSSCAYLLLGEELLPVEASDALGLPRAVRLAVASRAAPFAGLRPGMSGFVGTGSIQVGALAVRIGGCWEPRRITTGVRRDRLADVAGSLPPCPPDWSPSSPAASLLGRGPGLTPAGDDVLAGMLLGARNNRRVHQQVWHDVRAAGLQRTTALSAALLQDAAEGYAIPAVRTLLRWLTGRGMATAGDVLRPVMKVGHTSGLALAWGVVAGADRALAESKEAA